MKQIMAVDAGHGYTKAISDHGGRVVFPSLIAPAPQCVDLAEFSQAQAIRIDGHPFVIGDGARPHATPLWTKNKAADPDTLRLILVAAAQLGAVGPVTFATGLPLSWFGMQRRAFRESLSGYGGVVELTPDRPAQRVWFESVVILPQGVAATASVLVAADMEPGAYLIADVGYRTTDYIVVEKGADGTLDYDPAAAGSLEMGMHAVTQEIAQAMSDQYQVDYSPVEIDSKRSVVIRGRKIDLTARSRTACETVGQRIAKTLAERLGPRAAKLMGIVAVGGGSALLSAAWPGVLVPREAQWANVQGYLAALS